MDSKEHDISCDVGRASEMDVELSRLKLLSNDLFHQTVKDFPEIVLVLNDHRQIVYCNSHTLNFLERPDCNDILGKRFGEAFNCVNSSLDPRGCGYSEFCEKCGGFRATICAQKDGNPAIEKCDLVVYCKKNEISLDLKVSAIPLKTHKYKFILLAVKDISAEKEKIILERVFFHDIFNEAMAVNNLAEMMNVKEMEEGGKGSFNAISDFSSMLVDTVRFYSMLFSVENGTYIANREEFSVSELLNEVVNFYNRNSRETSCKAFFEEGKNPCTISSDKNILRAVLLQLLKDNSIYLEEKDKIVVGYQNKGNKILLYVNTPYVIPDTVAATIFNRPYSDIASRLQGVGAYGAKLFVERCLGGKVFVETDEPEGSTFFIEI